MGSRRASSEPGSWLTARQKSKAKEAPGVKVAHFDCFSGISGDMTVAALIVAGVEQAAIEQGGKRKRRKKRRKEA
jgi:hypothetical protein